MEKEDVNIKSLLRYKHEDLKNRLSILLGHPVTKGDHSERAWIEFFRSFLPSRYAIDKGFVVDVHGNKSEQIDIIIYDSLYSPLIFETDAHEKYVTAESVYAVFECKPNIDKVNLEYANKKIDSVTNLFRTARGVVNAGVECAPREHIKIIGGILAVDAVNSDTLKTHLKEYTSIDIGCAINEMSFLAKRDKHNVLIDFKVSNKEEAIIALFFMILDELYKRGTVVGIDIRDYAYVAVDSIKLDKGGL